MHGATVKIIASLFNTKYKLIEKMPLGRQELITSKRHLLFPMTRHGATREEGFCILIFYVCVCNLITILQ
jgi:hypothetical protein